jgi:hypothetical protein
MSAGDVTQDLMFFTKQRIVSLEINPRGRVEKW